MTSLEPKFFSVDEVAEILKVRSFTVYRWVSRGLLPAVRIGRTLRISADAICELAHKKENVNNPTKGEKLDAAENTKNSRAAK